MASTNPPRNGCAVLALGQAGTALGRRLAQSLPGDFFPCTGRLPEVMHTVWHGYREIVCVMAAGIVVRSIAPLLRDKQHDPAVVVCDVAGRFAVSLLSGHLGGANALAQRVALCTGGQAVLTTASDTLGRTALDLWCRDQGLVPASKSAFTRAMAQLVDQGRLTIWSRLPLPELPPDLCAVATADQADLVIDNQTTAPTGATLLHPKNLALGVGCNRGTSAAAIARAVEATCAQHALAQASIARLASIDLKADEPGLLEFARDRGLPLVFYNKDQLNEVEGVDASAVVERVTGARAVAEPAALLAAGPGATLLCPKMKWTDVTTALADRKSVV